MNRANTKSSHGGRSFSANRTQSSTANNNSKYPEIRQRGFYSDVLPPETQPTLGVCKAFSSKVIRIINILTSQSIKCFFATIGENNFDVICRMYCKDPRQNRVHCGMWLRRNILHKVDDYLHPFTLQ